MDRKCVDGYDTKTATYNHECYCDRYTTLSTILIAIQAFGQQGCCVIYKEIRLSVQHELASGEICFAFRSKSSHNLP